METKESITSETIADVISDMRKGVLDWKGERIGVFDHFADRIEAAAKRLLRRNEMLKIRLKCIEEEYLKTKRENDRLRAALDECVRCAERYEMDDDYQMSDICRDIRDCRRDAMGDEYLGFDKENKLLRAALKPVLSFDIDTHPCDGYCVMLNAVREAQRIAMEGEAK